MTHRVCTDKYCCWLGTVSYPTVFVLPTTAGLTCQGFIKQHLAPVRLGHLQHLQHCLHINNPVSTALP
jgi:hypothetical protein